jgi:hypothetical protein
MGNLYKEYGVGEFQERVMGAVVNYEGRPFLTREVTNGGRTVAGTRITGESVGRLKLEESSIPMSFFDTMENLRYPTLGYRTADNGEYLVYMSRRPSAVRKGLHPGRLSVSKSALTDHIQHYLGRDFRQYGTAEALAFLVYHPTIMTLEEGLRKIKSKEIVSFLIDENFAIVPAANGTGYLTIYYKERIVGDVSENGTIALTSRWAKPAFDQVTKQKV